jgi:hypothetical protein
MGSNDEELLEFDASLIARMSRSRISIVMICERFCRIHALHISFVSPEKSIVVLYI